MSNDENRFGADIAFNPGESGTCEFWAEISATDHAGVSVEHLKVDDEIRLIEVSGVCTFADEGIGTILSMISLSIAPFGGAATTWAAAVGEMRKQLLPKKGFQETRRVRTRNRWCWKFRYRRRRHHLHAVYRGAAVLQWQAEGHGQ